ncbi:alpha/beta hydrolase family protein [Deinococcus sp. A31D244]|uniref:alpha/beta hydrolase family protein n=1 Tax=Deinococcus sp. A31D244 TaxID=3397675 RepID=UPI0039DF41E2
MTRAFDPADPHATPLAGGRPYRVVRRVLGGVPCLLELPPEGQAVTALCVVYHGAWAAKEGKLGVYAALAADRAGGGGAAVLLPDAALHGERQGDTPPGLNAREYVWESVRRTVAEAPALLEALHAEFSAEFGPEIWPEFRSAPLWLVGSSMGGYVVQTLRRTLPDAGFPVARTAALITSGVWQEPEVRGPHLRAFLDTYRPVTHVAELPVTPLLLASGEADPTFPLAAHHAPTAAAYRAAFAQAGADAGLVERTFAGVGHYTSVQMQSAVLAFLEEGRPPA